MPNGTILFGGSGFLGPYILSADPEIVSVGRTKPAVNNRHVHIDSLADLSVLRDIEFDKVIYIIGNTEHHNLEKPVLSPGEQTAFDYHVTPLIQTLEQLKQYPVKKFVHFSTILMYDENQPALPVNEEAAISPYRNRYVHSKYLAEELSKFYSRWIPIITIRLSNIYGGCPLHRSDIIHKVARQLLETGRAEMWSTRPERDFIYVEDAARALLQLLDSSFTGTLNLGTGVMTSLSRVRELLEQVSGCPIDVLDAPVTGPMQFQCDIAKLQSAIDWQPRVMLDEGIRLTWDKLQSYPR